MEFNDRASPHGKTSQFYIYKLVSMFINPQNSLTNELFDQELQTVTGELTSLVTQLNQSTMSGQGISSQQSQELQSLEHIIELLVLVAEISNEESQIAQNAAGSGNLASGALMLPQNPLGPFPMMDTPIDSATVTPLSSATAINPHHAHHPHTYTLTTTDTYTPTASTHVTSFGIV